MYKIYISPSLQKHNKGVGKYGTEQMRMNEIADFLVAMLEKSKRFIVYRSEPNMTLKQVIADSNAKKVNLHIPLHSNAGNGQARGCEVWYNLLSVNGKKLAQCIYDKLAIQTPTTDRGIKGTIGLAEVKTKAVCALIEDIFHDNIDDVTWALSHRQAIAKAIYEGIIKYLEVAA